MSIFKPLFRRIAEENGEIPNLWTYDELPQNVRVQIWRQIIKIRECQSDSEFISFIKIVRDYLCDEIGVNRLNKYHDDYFGDVSKEVEYFFYNGLENTNSQTNFRYALSFIEVVCRLIVGIIKNAEFDSEKEKMSSIIDMINYRLKEAKIGWTFNTDARMLMRVDDEATYQLAIKPAFQLLSNVKFKETTDNFINAYQAYQEGGHKNLESAVDFAIKTLESAIRNICKIKKYDFNENATLHPLIQTLIRNRYFPNYHDDYLNSMEKIFMESGVIRNKMTGHGKEEDKAKDVKKVLDNNLVEFVLSQTASCIVFFIKNLNNT